MTIAQSPRSDKFPTEVTALRLQLRRNGFEPLPAHSKESVIKGWPLPHNDKQIRRSTGWDDKEIKAWTHRVGWDDEQNQSWAEFYPRATNTVFDAKFTPGLYINIWIEPATKAVEDLARKFFAGHGDIHVRLGWPTGELSNRRLILLRTDESFAKLSRTFIAPDDSKQTIEVLGDGEHYVVDGDVAGGITTPRTLYRWSGGNLETINRKDLPYVRREDMERFLEAATKLLVEQFGYVQHTATLELEWLRRQFAKQRAQIEAYKAANPEPSPRTLQEIRKMLVELKEHDKKHNLNTTVDDIISYLKKYYFELIRDWRHPRERLRHHIEPIWAELQPPPPRKTIRIVKGEVARIVDEAEAALLAVANVVPIMVRAGMLVQPIVDQLPASHDRMTDVTLLKPLTNANIIYLLNKHAAIFGHYDGRSKKWLAIDPPPSVATQLLQKGHWKFPKVAGVITAPTLRPDGSVLEAPGYDPATQLWYAPDGALTMPSCKQNPSREDAEQALALFDDLFSGFPFVSEVDRSVALASLLTCVLRGAFEVAPMHLFRAHDVGSGKSLLADLMSTVARGLPCPVITFVKSVEEMEKRLGALVLEGVPMVSLDNCSGNIGGDLLCQITERPLIRIRILGKSEAPECEWRGVLLGTGNNITLTGDMTRRGLIANLNPKVERPELRQFKFDPIERVLNNRGAYIAAAITIARAYIAAGRPPVCRPLGSYGGWSQVVRSPLIWLGKQDPVKSMDEIREEDPERRALHALIELWREHLGLNIGYTANQLIFHANSLAQPISEPEEARPELRDLLIQRASVRGNIDTKSLGNWLMSVRGRVHDGMCIELVKEDRAHGNKYALTEISGES